MIENLMFTPEVKAPVYNFVIFYIVHDDDQYLIFDTIPFNPFYLTVNRKDHITFDHNINLNLSFVNLF